MIYCFLSFDFFLSENIFKRCRPFERLSATFHNDLLGLLFLNVVGPSDVFGAFFAVQRKSSLFLPLFVRANDFVAELKCETRRGQKFITSSRLLKCELVLCVHYHLSRVKLLRKFFPREENPFMR